MNDSLPAGWYTDESGQRKYWTGTEWIAPLEQSENQMQAPLASLPAPQDPYATPSNVFASPTEPPAARKKTGVIAGVLAAVLVLGGAGAWYAVDQNNKAEAAKIAQEKAEADKKAEEAAAKKKADAAAAALAAAEQAAADEAAELAAWEEDVAMAVDGLEELGMDLAADSRKEGLYIDKVLEVQCQAASGSTDDELGVSSTEYSCLAVTKKEDDGQSSGYGMTGLIDWNSGQMQINWDF